MENKKYFKNYTSVLIKMSNEDLQHWYKVIKETLKKSERIHVVFFQVIVNTHEVVAESKRVT